MLAVVIISAVATLGVSTYNFKIEEMDLNAPTIITKPPHLPAPPRKQHSDFPPVVHPVEPAPPCYSDGDPCQAREVKFI